MIYKKYADKKTVVIVMLFCTLSGGLFAGCIHEKNNEPIAVGQPVVLSYACELNNGELLSTTETDTINKLQADPFSVFIGPGSTDNVVIEAGKDTLSENPNSQDKLRDFQAVLKNEIGKRIVGMHAGETFGMSIKAEDTPDLSPDERFIRMARRILRPKKKTLSLSSFGRGDGSIPEIGSDMTRSAEPWLKGEVTAVDETQVTVTYSADIGKTVETSYGPSLISENETQYIIDIDAADGKLVRAGGFLGRIVAVEEDVFTIDFGNPFGGEEVYCDVTVEAVPDHSAAKPADDRSAPAVSGKGDASYGGRTAATGVTENGTPPLLKPDTARDNGTDAAHGVSTLRAADGDLITFDFTLQSQDGTVVMNSRHSGYENEDLKQNGSSKEKALFEPVQTVLGRNEIVPFIENTLYGMKAGETKKIHFEPKDAYGEKDPEKIKSYPRVKAIPEVINTTRGEFRKRFKVDPQPGKQVQVIPLFQSKVVSVDGDHVVIKHLVEDGTVVPGDLGSTKIVIKDGKIVMTLLPNSGAAFEANGEHGIMTGYDEEHFVVDFNPPHAGESFFLDVDVRSVVKKAAYEKDIRWEKSLDEVFEDIDSIHKPAVLVLYASWCGWSKKLLSETLKDPRITSLSDRFLWLKVDTDKDQGIYDLYEQNSYPTVVLLSNNGKVYRKLEGFTNAEKLSKALNDLL